MERATSLGNVTPTYRFLQPGTSANHGRKAEELARDHQQWADAQPTTQLCGFCPDFRYQGRADDGRQAFADHVAAAHPEKRDRRRSRRGHSMGRMKQARDRLDVTEHAEAMVEVKRRRATTHASEGQL